jgi:hypothetical protein
VIVRRTTTSAKKKNGTVPTEMKPFREPTEKQKRFFAKSRSVKNGTAFDDELAALNQEIAEQKTHVQDVDGKLMIPVQYLPKKRIEKGVISRPKKKREMSEKKKLQQIENRQRAEQALELRKAGVAYQKIADSLGYSSAGAAKNSVDNLMKKQEFEAAKDVVLIDLQRLDEYQMRCTERLRNNGDLGQIDRLMRIMEMRYRILGVNEETTAELQQHFGLNVVNKGVMVVQGSETDFVKAMMQAVGVDPNTEEGKKYLTASVSREIADAPMLGSEEAKYDDRRAIPDAEIVDAEIVDALDHPAYNIDI